MVFGDSDNICGSTCLLRGSHGNWIIVGGLRDTLESAETSETIFPPFKNFLEYHWSVARD